MGKSGSTVDPSRHAEGTTVLWRVVKFLQAVHPVWTAKYVAHDTGIATDTVKKWLSRGSAPSAAHLLTLGLTYGLDFLAAIYLEVDDVEMAARQARLRRLERQTAVARQSVETRP